MYVEKGNTCLLNCCLKNPHRTLSPLQLSFCHMSCQFSVGMLMLCLLKTRTFSSWEETSNYCYSDCFHCMPTWCSWTCACCNTCQSWHLSSLWWWLCLSVCQKFSVCQTLKNVCVQNNFSCGAEHVDWREEFFPFFSKVAIKMPAPECRVRSTPIIFSLFLSFHYRIGAVVGNRCNSTQFIQLSTYINDNRFVLWLILYY